jgi:predicted RNA-binding Zn ribbon-like protein
MLTPVTDSWRGYHLIGGNVALDLVNTVSWRLDPAQTFDRLAAPDFLPLWLTRTGLLPQTPDHVEPGVINSLSRLRETVYRLLIAPSSADVARFGKWFTAARARAVAEPSLPLRWTVPISGLADVVPALTVAADELLSSPEAALVRQCSGPGCGWLFIDRTRNHSRQWCSSLDCGNRERARRHYRRSKERT